MSLLQETQEEENHRYDLEHEEDENRKKKRCCPI